MPVLTIARNVLGQARWSLGISTIAFFGLALLWNWGISAYQFPSDDPEDEAEARAETDPEVIEGDEPKPDVDERPRRRRRAGPQVYVAFGVPAERIIGFNRDESPTLLMQVSMANHPLIFLALLGWATGRAAGSVAGEVERGTLDLTLSRPVRRSTYLAGQVLATVIAFVLLIGATIAGHLAAPMVFRISAPPAALEYLPAAAMTLGFCLAVFGYCLPFSSRDLSRARAGLLGLGVTLLGIAALITASQYEQYDWLSKLSVFEYYAPVGITLDWVRERSIDLYTLFGIFGVGLVLSAVAFLTRDLPSNSG